MITLGAIVQEWRVDGVGHSLVLGTTDVEAYLGPMRYVGAVVGRFANRIAGASFELDGRRHRVPANWLGRHALHGGDRGMDLRVWTVESTSDDSVELSLTLPDGDMGFPGELRVELVISLTERRALAFDMTATTSAATPCSLAHHGYFNLDGTPDVCDHLLRVDAEQYLPVDGELIPVGGPAPVVGTPFDLREAVAVGQRGVDHNFCLRSAGAGRRPVARLEGPATGLALVVETDQPGLQVYDGAKLDAPGVTAVDGRPLGAHAGIALETQAWPDSPNRPDFPSSILRPGERYRHEVHYRIETPTG